MDQGQFQAWLRERGVEGSRRVVRESADVILVSKFPAGFAARLHDALDRLPELFQAERLVTHTTAATGIARVEAWRLAVDALVRELGPQRDLSLDEVNEIQAGVDSVAALLDSVLWSSPTVGAPWQASQGERQAFAEALERMDDESSIFTRYYGDFEGKRVENHCPGAQVARRLFQQAWQACTADA
jgi:hypothetical protein